MNKNILLGGIAVIAAGVFFACGGGEADSSLIKVDSTKIAGDTIDDTKSKIEQAQKVYYSIPSTSEMASLLTTAGAEYNMKLVNDINFVDKYTTPRKQALNLGIYGADLNYCSVYERTNETMFYMECTRSLAEKLGIENAITDETVTRAEENIDNRDSMLTIISDMFYELEEYLAENDKDELSALIIGAGWVEGLYLATQTVNEKKPNQDIMSRIAEQKLSLGNLMKFIEQYIADEDVKSLYGDLTRISKIYEGIVVEKQDTKVSTDSDGKTVIGGTTKVEMSTEQFKELRKVVKEIRDSYTKIK
ncbi:MAG: hypothetical protein ACK40M_00480 [Flavobacteriales bacterium]